MKVYIPIILLILLSASSAYAYIGISVGPYINGLFQSDASTVGGQVAYKGLPIIEPYGGFFLRWKTAVGLKYFGGLAGSYLIFYDWGGVKPHADINFQYEHTTSDFDTGNIYVNCGIGVHLDYHPRIIPVISGGVSVNFHEREDDPYTPEKSPTYYGYFNYTMQINL